MNLDPEFTRELQQWLNTPASERDIAAGAMLMLRLNGNKALYNGIMAKPQQMHAKLEYELKKHLQIRLDNMTLNEVAQMQHEVMPRVATIVKENSSSVLQTEDELPDATVARGRRADHDQLPDHIKALWDNNAAYYKRIKLLYNECLAMTDAGAQPCDLYERLKLLDQADKTYRDNLARYDSYVVGSESEPEPENPNDIAKKISAARKNLSKWRTKFGNADSAEEEDRAKAKMQENVDIILEYGGTFSDDTLNFFISIGLNV